MPMGSKRRRERQSPLHLTQRSQEAQTAIPRHAFRMALSFEPEAEAANQQHFCYLASTIDALIIVGRGFITLPFKIFHAHLETVCVADALLATLRLVMRANSRI